MVSSETGRNWSRAARKGLQSLDQVCLAKEGSGQEEGARGDLECLASNSSRTLMGKLARPPDDRA